MNENFLEILHKNDSNEMQKFLLTNGKKPKPHSPIYFINKDEEQKGDVKDGRKTEHESIDDRDQGDNKEAEVC